MSKYLKVFNEQTQQWELVSAPDVNVEQRLEDGSKITDSNVIVENEYYAKGDSGKTLYETLTDIGGDMRKLQRNVSWLAEHGGGSGTGGGGGAIASFGIEIISPIVENGAAYVSGKTFDIEFMITGGTVGDACMYSYAYDTMVATDPKPIEVNKTVKIPIDNTESTRKEHSITIYGTNPYNATILPKTAKIYESTLTLVFDTATAGDNYQNGVLRVSQNDPDGFVPFILTDGLLNSHVVLQADYNGRITTIEFTNGTTDPQNVNMRLWDIIPSISTNVYYVVNFKATATVSSIGTTVESDTVPVRLRVISPSEITISMGINGEDGDTPVPVSLSSVMNYNFKIYGPTSVTSVYYSAKLVKGSDETLILGQYYDENLHEPDAESFTSNTLTYIETTISSQYYLSPFIFETGDTLQLYIKAWDIEGRQTGETYMTINVIEASNEVFPQQYGTRGGAGYTAHTQFASWNAYNTSPTNRQKWVSHVDGYSFLDTTLAQQENSAVTLNLEIKNANDSSGIVDDNFPPYMRIQNKAYATIDFSYYAAEISAMTNMRTGGNPDGFTISVCTESDEHSDNQHTLFLWGTNDADGRISSGIRIDINKALWRIGDNELSCPISFGSRNMLDFSYVRNGNTGTIRIYLNGVLNAAKDIKASEFSMQLPNIAYIGASYRNGVVERFSDFDLYEISVYTKALNDLQLVVNSENARFTNMIEYNNWKIKNFISSTQEQPTVPKSVFFNNGNYIKDFDTTDIDNISSVSNIPTLRLFFEQGTDFTEEFFYKKYDTDITNLKFDATAEYYDPNTNRENVRFAAKVSLQGTTTLGYRVKNLELYIDEKTTVKGNEVVKLFQPKKEWFPESQFTLKADVVDSAHANNAVLGEWINNCGLMADNPAMEQFNDNTRPKDVDDEGNVYTHMKPGTTTEVDCDEDVTIKHTLEGFPILLFIYFDGGRAYNFIGIYSFNLGRHSYYNMGMKFLKNFSRRGANKEKVSCPKLINYYEEMDTLGTVSAADVYSFEFGNDGNLHVAEYPVWSQYNKSVIQSYGEFKYPTVGTTDTIWDKLCTLFETVAKFDITEYYGTPITTYRNIYPYIVDESGYHPTGGPKIPEESGSIQGILDHLHTGNTVAYFMIANAFGMTDSLGKNMTLRTWDNGEYWYPVFYDMDSALAIENDGNLNEAVDISIDKIDMITEGTSNRLETTYHYQRSRYAAYLAKLWGVFRDTRYRYQCGGEARPYYYELVWAQLRRTGGKLSKATNFTDIMATRVETCGEMIYDYDYNMKYIQDAEDTGGTESSINFLHGTRVEFVKDWLKRHLYYLDGVFDVKRLSGTAFQFEDSPYYADIANIGVSYPETMQNLIYAIQVSTPTFLGLTVGNAPAQKYYISEANTPTNIYYPNASSSSSQLALNGSTLVTRMNGFQTGFRTNTIAGVAGSLRSLSEFDASNSMALNGDNIGPFSTKDFILNGTSALETLNMSYTMGTSILTTYDVDLSDFNKVLNINISNSQVTSLKLPKSTLQTLNITNSKLRSFKMENQNKLTSVSFDGCNDLSKIELINCGALESINISDKPNLSSVSILNCQSVSAITISGNTALSNIEIGNNSGLKRITITDCKNPLLDINIYGSALEEIIIKDIETTNVIKLPSKELLTGVTTLNLIHDFYITGIKYGSEEIEYYNEEPIFDISPLTSLNERNLNLSYVTTLKYLRVPNIEDKPFKIYNASINKCDSLTRIFGHIDITNETTFSTFNNFFLNEMDEMPEWSDTKPAFVSDDSGYTNITISATDLSNCFTNTSCNLLDVYTVFRSITSAVTTIYYMFSRCSQIVVEPAYSLPSHLFINCTNVVNINGLFADCSNIFSCLDEDILLPVIDNITEFNSVFRSCRVFIWIQGSRKTIFPAGNNIVSIDSFNPTYSLKKESYDGYQIESNAILANLDKLERLSSSYNGLYIDFQLDGDILYNTTSLTEIQSSFTRISPHNSDLVIKHLLGQVDSEHYPQGLIYVTNSFTFSTDESALALGNTFFGNSNATLRDIRGSFTGIRKVIDFEDCSGLTFPYEIFSDCTNLTSVAGFFEGLDCGNEGSVNTFTLPSYIIDEHNRIDILGDCVNVTDASRLFADMKNAQYTLVGKGFKNNSLTNVSGIFSGQLSSGLVGGIPFKLFYEEENGFPKKTITNMSGAFYFCNSSAMTYYDAVATISDEDLYENNPYYIEGSTDEDTKYPYIWNKYAYDGTGDISGETAFYDKVINSAIYSSGNISQTLPAEFIPGYSDPGKDATQISSDDIGTKSGGIPYTDLEKQEIFAKRNYFCPPDIFRYCVNDKSTAVENVFAYTSNSDINGLHGTIPPYIFEPISQVFSLNGMFSYCKLLLPYSWGYDYIDEYEEKVTIYGEFLPKGLFSGMTNLYSISGMFANSRIWGRTKFDLSILPQTLVDINSLFNVCTWVGNAGLDGDLFSLTQLANVSSMFRMSGPLTMPRILLSQYNSRISSCAYFMYSNTRTSSGVLPDLWNFPLLSNASMNNIIGSFANINSVWKEKIPTNINWWFTHAY